VTLFFSFDENVTLVRANRISNQNQQHAFEPGKNVVAGKPPGGVLARKQRIKFVASGAASCTS
jgi:hypothetical protein